MSTEQSIYLEENVSDIMLAPGFPYLRMHPALRRGESAPNISDPEEQLLLAMHSNWKRLLVISNKHIYIYKIPYEDVVNMVHPVTGLRAVLRFIVSVIKLILAFVPLVGELIDGIESLMSPFEWLWHRISGKARKEHEEALRTIMGLKAMFLLYNPSKWKTKFKASFVNPRGLVTIGVEGGGIRIADGRKKAFVPYLNQDWGPLKIAENLIEPNRQALEASGWSVGTTGQGYVFKNSR